MDPGAAGRGIAGASADRRRRLRFSMAHDIAARRRSMTVYAIGQLNFRVEPDSLSLGGTGNKVNLLC